MSLLCYTFYFLSHLILITYMASKITHFINEEIGVKKV